MPLLAVLTACGGEDLDVSVAVDPTLAGEIRVVTARGARPGETNPIEAVVVLRNDGAAERQVLLEASWHDDGAGFFGGASAVRSLAPGQSDTFSAGTRSGDVTTFRLVVSPTGSTQDEILTATLADATPKAAGHGITYTETPSREAIPAWTVRGVANGTPFTAGTVMFVPDGRGWRLEISDAPLDPLQGAGIARHGRKDLQTVSLDLGAEPAPGRVLEREMAYGGGHFQIKRTPAAESTTSWNTSIAWVIEFTDWRRDPWSDGADTSRRAGTASGRLYVAFRGSEHGPSDSWISGTFEDAPIVYHGRPRAD